MKKRWEGALNLVYPKRCPFCQEVMPGRFSVCPDCREEVRPLGGSRCLCCGRPLRGQEEYCPDCLLPRHFREGRGIYLYDRRMRRAVLAFKEGGNRVYADAFGRAMAFYGREFLTRNRPDALAGIPLHKRVLLRRGFNQAALLADVISSQTGIPAREDLLYKVRYTPPQKKQEGEERRKNLQGSFRAGEAQGLSICLVDDVYTTGSTLEEAARTLYLAGARDVTFLTLCQVDPWGAALEEGEEGSF